MNAYRRIVFCNHSNFAKIIHLDHSEFPSILWGFLNGKMRTNLQFLTWDMRLVISCVLMTILCITIAANESIVGMEVVSVPSECSTKTELGDTVTVAYNCTAKSITGGTARYFYSY